MLNRRHIRIKVMQTLYAMQQSQSDKLDSNEKFLFQSLENIRNLYLLMFSVFIELQKAEEEFIELSSKKHLATAAEKNPNKKFINNRIFRLLLDSEKLNTAIEDNHIKDFVVHDQYVKSLLQEIKETEVYKDYMKSGKDSFEEDQKFVIQMFADIIAPNEKVYDYLEDAKLTWVDDIPVVNTCIMKQLKSLRSEKDYFRLPKIYRDEEDADYAKNLFRKTALNGIDLQKEYESKTKNWELDRIAGLDLIILNMAICELQKFPSIPVKVTINEYLEIAKEYSTPKSSIFINGILDALIKDYKSNDKLNKVGRGLLE